LPFALYQAGLVCGGILLLVSAWATATSIHLLVLACDKYRLPTYEKIVEKILGKRARTIVEWSILIFCCGTAVGYVIAVGDIMERIVYMTAPQKKLAMFTIWLGSMLPLSCLRRMKSLQCASSVGIASIGTLLAAAIVHLVRPAPDKEDYEDEEDTDVIVSMTNMAGLIGPAHASWLSVLQACPIFFYAFSCQVNVAQIYEELPGLYGNEKIRKMGWVTWSAVGICCLLYASISLVTLMDFGKHVTPNILSSYDLSGAAPLLHIAFLAMALAVVMAFPLNIFPARVSLIQMWEKDHGGEAMLCGGQDEEAKRPLLCSVENGLDVSENINHDERRPTLDYDSTGESPPRESLVYDPLRAPLDYRISTITDRGDGTADTLEEEETPDFHVFQHTSVTFLLAGLALGLALVIPNISIVFGLLGGTTSSLLGFIVPGLLGIQMDRKCISAWILVIAGSVIGVLTTSVTVYSTFHAVTR
jgi:amino acid permease